MLFIMERIDLALLIQIFKGFKSALPRPAPQVLPILAGRAGTGQDLDMVDTNMVDTDMVDTVDIFQG